MKTKFQNLPPEERVKALAATSDGVEEFNYQKQLSREDLDEYRENLTDKLIEKSTIEKEMATIVDEYKGQLKPIKNDVALLLDIVKNRQIEVKEECYLMADHEAGMMEYYNPAGELVYSRRIKPEERQTTIKQLNQAI